MADSRIVSTSDEGYLILCEACNEHTGVIFDVAGDYWCINCWIKQDTVVCECGADKTGGLHSDWCKKAKR